jgi:signal transduction histidine kinase
MIRNLRAQLSLSIIAVVLLAVVFIGLLSNIFIRRDFENYVYRQQQAKTANIAAILSHQYNPLTQDWDTAYIHGIGMLALDDGFIVKVFDLNGQSVWDAENHDISRCIRVMDEITARMERRKLETSGKFASQKYELTQNGHNVGEVLISYYFPYFLSDNDFKFIDSINGILIWVGLLSLPLSFIMGEFLAKRIARPVTKAAEAAKMICDGNYNIRLEQKTKTKELDELVFAVNNMAISLEKQENLRKRLTTDVAHELRTPLTAISSHLESMTLGIWEPTVERLKSCCEEARRISLLVSDLEKLAKAENDNLTLNKTKIDLKEIAALVSGNFEREAANKRINITVEGEPAFVFADKDRVCQIVANLLSNAIKYTPENGNVEISIKNTDNCGKICVKDTGCGIPQDELPFIFERFYRADKSRNRATGGAGIGLTIAKSVAQAHGGEIKVESKEGFGSCFIVELPILPVAP